MKHLLVTIQPHKRSVSCKPGQAEQRVWQQSAVCIFWGVHLSTNLLPSLDEQEDTLHQNLDKAALSCSSGCLWLGSNPTVPQTCSAQPTPGTRHMAWASKLSKMDSLGKMGCVQPCTEIWKYPCSTQDKVVLCDLHFSYWFGFRIFCRTRTSHRVEKKAPELSLWLTPAVSCKICQVTPLSAYKVGLNNGFRCIGRARWAHTGELKYVKCFKIPQLQTPKQIFIILEQC